MPGVDPVLAVGAGGVVLLGLWFGATTRHLRRRRAQGADWAVAERKPDLWTSAARCPGCGARGGLLELRGELVEFVCLTCGVRHQRESRG